MVNPSVSLIPKKWQNKLLDVIITNMIIPKNNFKTFSKPKTTTGFTHSTKFVNLMCGFTLIEAILYLAIAGTVLYFISGFAFNSIFGKAKIETIQDVNQNSRSVLDEISNTVNSSVEINGIVQ